MSGGDDHAALEQTPYDRLRPGQLRRERHFRDAAVREKAVEQLRIRIATVHVRMGAEPV